VGGKLVVLGNLTIPFPATLTVGGNIIIVGTKPYLGLNKAVTSTDLSVAEPIVQKYRDFITSVKNKVEFEEKERVDDYLPGAYGENPVPTTFGLYKSAYDPYGTSLKSIDFGVRNFKKVTQDEVKANPKGDALIDVSLMETMKINDNNVYGMTLVGEFNTQIPQVLVTPEYDPDNPDADRTPVLRDKPGYNAKRILIDPDTGNSTSAKAVIINLINFKMSDGLYFCVKEGAKRKVYFYIPGADESAFFGETISGNCTFEGSAFMQEEYLKPVEDDFKDGVLISGPNENGPTQPKTMVVMNGTGTLKITNVEKFPVVASLLLPYSTLQVESTGGKGVVKYGEGENPPTISNVAYIGCILVREFDSGSSDASIVYVKFTVENVNGGYRILKDRDNADVCIRVYDDGTVIQPRLISEGLLTTIPYANDTPDYYAEVKKIYDSDINSKPIISYNPAAAEGESKWGPTITQYPDGMIPEGKEVIYYSYGDGSSAPVEIIGTGYYNGEGNPVTVYFETVEGGGYIPVKYSVNGGAKEDYDSTSPIMLWKDINLVGDEWSLAPIVPDTPGEPVSPPSEAIEFTEIPIYILDAKGNPILGSDPDSGDRIYRKDETGKLILDWESKPILVTNTDYIWRAVPR
jgi:hypothetical protein